MRVLIAEDNEGILKLLPRMLGIAMPGATVEIAATPEEQSRKLSEAKDCDVVFQDINGPDGNDFPYQEAIASDSVRAVVMISSEAHQGMVGGKVFLCQKPFNLDDLKKVAQEVQDFVSCVAV